MARIIQAGPLTFDLDRLKVVEKEKNVLILKFNTRIKYSKNPFTDEIEKREVVDIISHEFRDWDTAESCRKEIIECWEQ